LTRAVGALVGLSGLGALAACTGEETTAFAERVRAAMPVTLPPTTPAVDPLGAARPRQRRSDNRRRGLTPVTVTEIVKP
jgi:hypothetical protein